MKKKSLFNPEFLFVLLGLIIGIFYCAAIPYGAGFDEERHIVRIYDLSGGYILPNRNPPSYKSTVTLKEFAELSYQRRFVQSPAWDMFSPGTFWQKFSHQEQDVVYGYQGGSIYSPVIFFPQAMMARLAWRKFDLPILPIVILMRVAGLLFYVAGSWLAIRLVPTGKWVFAVLALSPMALFQATTLNADGFTNAASFLFIGLTLSIYANEPAIISRRWVWALIGGALLLGAAKPGAIILLPLLLILPKTRFASRKWIILLALGAALAILINVGWIMVAVQNSKFAAGGSDSVSRQLGLVASNLSGFMVTYLKGLFDSLIPYFKDWTAAFGYRAGEPPGLLYPFYALTLLLAILAEPRTDGLSRNARMFMTGLFLLASAALATAYFVIYYTPGSAGALGRHGRYFIAFAPLFFIALSGLVSIHERWRAAMPFAAVASFLAVIGFYSFGIYTTYYTFCGYQAYAGDQCFLPVYKNLEKEDLPEIKLHAGTTLSQTFTSHCAGLENVQVFVNSVPAGGAGNVKYSLLDENQQLIASETIPISGIPAGDYLTLPVPSPAGARNSRFEILLEALDSNAPEGMGLGIIPGGFHDGSLSISGEESRGDLLFHYACARP